MCRFHLQWRQDQLRTKAPALVPVVAAFVFAAFVFAAFVFASASAAAAAAAAAVVVVAAAVVLLAVDVPALARAREPAHNNATDDTRVIGTEARQ